MRLETHELWIASTTLRFRERLPQSVLREQYLFLLERSHHREQLSTRIFGAGILSGQHEVGGRRGKLHGGKLQEGLSRPGRGIHVAKPRVRQEPKSFVCLGACDQSWMVCE